MVTTHITGKTRDAGFEIGVRKTFEIDLAGAWTLLFSPDGLKLWLGDMDNHKLEMKKQFRTDAGITGKVNVLKPHSHVRLHWKKPDWSNSSTLQVRVIQSKEKTTISFHQEKLLDGKQRQEMKAYWDEVMKALEKQITG